MSALGATVAHTAEPISPRARHYDDQFRTLLALKLVDALRALEAAQEAADAASVTSPGDGYERAWFDLRTAQIEVDRITDQLGLRGRYSGRDGA